MKVKDIFNMINADFPFSNAFDGDNVGLIVGDGDAETLKKFCSPAMLTRALRQRRCGLAQTL